MPPEPLQSTLVAIARLLHSSTEPWWIIGSAAVVLHGVTTIAPRDIDVLLGEADARAILPHSGITIACGVPDRCFRSQLFASWREQPLAVEFMAGFAHLASGQWRDLVPESREIIAVQGEHVFVPTREELIGILERFGRPKDLERARMLRRHD